MIRRTTRAFHRERKANTAQACAFVLPLLSSELHGRCRRLRRRYRFLQHHMHIPSYVNSQTISFQSRRSRDYLAGVIDSRKFSRCPYVKYLSVLIFPSLAASMNDDFCDSRVSRKTLVTLAKLIHRSNGSSQFRKDRIMWWLFLCMYIRQGSACAFFCHRSHLM